MVVSLEVRLRLVLELLERDLRSEGREDLIWVLIEVEKDYGERREDGIVFVRPVKGFLLLAFLLGFFVVDFFPFIFNGICREF